MSGSEADTSNGESSSLTFSCEIDGRSLWQFLQDYRGLMTSLAGSHDKNFLRALNESYTIYKLYPSFCFQFTLEALLSDEGPAVDQRAGAAGSAGDAESVNEIVKRIQLGAVHWRNVLKPYRERMKFLDDAQTTAAWFLAELCDQYGLQGRWLCEAQKYCRKIYAGLRLPNPSPRYGVDSYSDPKDPEATTWPDCLGDRINNLPEQMRKAIWESEDQLRLLHSRLIGSAEHSQADSGSGRSTRKRSKKSTERGEGQAKLIAALTKHHQYADGGCLNLEPIGCNELAKLAGVSASTASTFFKDKFKGHLKYSRDFCRDLQKLKSALKLLNGEYAPHCLLGMKDSDLAARE